ncbi:hypothetical protein [uncultured Nostoc sp.]|uniref:hypothetical protein n=1 Tax=uncultured Nostoc sp. TaxID=340711 RepID=UPI0035CA515A
MHGPKPDEDMPFRMADYRLRVYRRFPNKRMHQVVIYLAKTESEKVYQTTFTTEKVSSRSLIQQISQFKKD